MDNRKQFETRFIDIVFHGFIQIEFKLKRVCFYLLKVYFKSIFSSGFRVQLNTKDRVMNETYLYVYSGKYSRLLTMRVRVHTLFIVKHL